MVELSASASGIVLYTEEIYLDLLVANFTKDVREWRLIERPCGANVVVNPRHTFAPTDGKEHQLKLWAGIFNMIHMVDGDPLPDLEAKEAHLIHASLTTCALGNSFPVWVGNSETQFLALLEEMRQFGYSRPYTPQPGVDGCEARWWFVPPPTVGFRALAPLVSTAYECDTLLPVRPAEGQPLPQCTLALAEQWAVVCGSVDAASGALLQPRTPEGRRLQLQREALLKWPRLPMWMGTELYRAVQAAIIAMPTAGLELPVQLRRESHIQLGEGPMSAMTMLSVGNCAVSFHCVYTYAEVGRAELKGGPAQSAALRFACAGGSGIQRAIAVSLCVHVSPDKNTIVGTTSGVDVAPLLRNNLCLDIDKMRAPAYRVCACGYAPSNRRESRFEYHTSNNPAAQVINSPGQPAALENLPLWNLMLSGPNFDLCQWLPQRVASRTPHAKAVTLFYELVHFLDQRYNIPAERNTLEQCLKDGPNAATKYYFDRQTSCIARLPTPPPLNSGLVLLQTYLHQLRLDNGLLKLSVNTGTRRLLYASLLLPGSAPNPATGAWPAPHSKDNLPRITPVLVKLTRPQNLGTLTTAVLFDDKACDYGQAMVAASSANRCALMATLRRSNDLAAMPTVLTQADMQFGSAVWDTAVGIGAPSAWPTFDHLRYKAGALYSQPFPSADPTPNAEAGAGVLQQQNIRTVSAKHRYRTSLLTREYPTEYTGVATLVGSTAYNRTYVWDDGVAASYSLLPVQTEPTERSWPDPRLIPTGMPQQHPWHDHTM